MGSISQELLGCQLRRSSFFRKLVGEGLSEGIFFLGPTRRLSVASLYDEEGVTHTSGEVRDEPSTQCRPSSFFHAEVDAHCL